MNKKYIEELVRAILQIRNESGLMNLLHGILTPKELDEITVRLQIVKMLKKGVPQHEIAKKLSVGIATVTRGSKEIQKGNFKSI